MKQNDYVIINNRAYDPVTGLPVDGVLISQPEESVNKPEARPSSLRGIATPSVHSSMQRSSTLSRRHVKKPRVIMPLNAETEAPVINYSPISLSQFVTKKAAEVEKFTPKRSTAPTRVDRPAQAHPVAQRATGRSLDIMAPQRQRAAVQQRLNSQSKLAEAPVAPVKKIEQKPAHVLKNEAIFEAMNREVESQKPRRAKRQKKTRSWGRFMGIASASLAIVMLAGYFTYLNMPNLSIKMAAIQSGINAKYPGYQPDGYSLRGPITFKDGEVQMQFAYVGGDQSFTLKQQRSSWDSSAVKQFAESKNPDVMTTTVDGLTIYSYGQEAAWVNGGVLYTVEGNAPLSGSQIQRIATSM